jgi:hypothetical protein
MPAEGIADGKEPVRWIEKRVGGRWAAATSVQAGAVLVAFVIASTVGVAGSAVRLTLIGLLALAMGGQNGVFAIEHGLGYPR